MSDEIDEYNDDMHEDEKEIHAYTAASDRLEMSARLVRRDQQMKGKSVCLTALGRENQCDANESSFLTDDMTPISLNSSGKIA